MLPACLREWPMRTCTFGAVLALLGTPVWSQAPPRAVAPRTQAVAAAVPAAAAAAKAGALAQPLRAEPAQSGLERELDAIRQALLRTTLEAAPTRVLSTAWIDTDGRLHESTQFHSDARVRGVRVLSYIQAPDQPASEPPTLGVVAPLPHGLGPKALTDPSACAADPLRWRQPLGLQLLASPTLMGEAAHTGQALLQLAGQAWQAQAQRSQRWRSTAQVALNLNPYERALLGPAPVATGWLAVLQLAPAQPAAPGMLQLLGLAGASQEAVFELSISVAHPLGGQPLWQASLPLRVPQAWRSQDPSAWMVLMADQLGGHMQQWVRQLDSASACEPVHFDLQETEAPWQLNAGAAHGLRLGDRLLIMDRRHLPQRILEPGSTERLALAEVAQLGPRGARLRQLAGPALAGRGDWVALPF
jgi:hypothetical protein